MLTVSRRISCPYCGEAIDIVVDLSVPEQRYVEDCSVCCQPMIIHYTNDGGELTELTAQQESE